MKIERWAHPFLPESLTGMYARGLISLDELLGRTARKAREMHGNGVDRTRPEENRRGWPKGKKRLRINATHWR